MTDITKNYSAYFEVDETYYPCVDLSALKGLDWKQTFPHETFIEMLDKTEKMLGGKTNRSLWIHGAYGTGKSRCVYTLKQILEAPESEVAEYWNKYDPLKVNTDLMFKLIGHKNQGIVTALSYASGNINTPQQLFFEVQESVKKALESHHISYKGENTLKESVIAWLEVERHKRFINDLLKEPKWRSTFPEGSADEIIEALKKSSEVPRLMDNIFALAAEEGITAMTLSSDSLRNWILDIIKTNNIKIVLLWDEFSDYFRKNSTSLGEFQKIVSICQEAPFYLVIVTHPFSSIAKSYDVSDKSNPWTVVQQRFERVEITLPDNIAFDLIGHAFKVKETAKSEWDKITGDFRTRVDGASKAVRKAANIPDSTDRVHSKDVMEKILPIHPMAALVLKNIASAFQSNQRSMFDFIKTRKEINGEAFQSFIQNNSPFSERPFLTVDMLWDFFYEKGKDSLSRDTRLILDTFQQHSRLTETEKIVLKTILILQAIDQRLGGFLAILKPTEQNLSYAFEGEGALYRQSNNIAKALVRKGILIERPIEGGKTAYSTAVYAGDNAKIERYKDNIRKLSTTERLVLEGPALASLLDLSPALKLRFAQDVDSGNIPVVTKTNFKQVMDSLKSKDTRWRCYAVLALAKTDDEALSFRTLIQKTITNPEYKHILVIDALSTPLGLESLERYVEFAAMAEYYRDNDRQQSKEQTGKSKFILENDWKNRIVEGSFRVFSSNNMAGESVTGADEVKKILKRTVLERFKHIQDFAEYPAERLKLSETQLKLTQAKNAARSGIVGRGDIKGLIKNCEKIVLDGFWGKERYWEDPNLQEKSIVIIKQAIDKMIQSAFQKEGKISIGEIYDSLESDYGFSPCNLSAFILGFLLKEYSAEPYRCMDEEGQTELMNPDKLADMIGSYIGKSSPKTTYIVCLTEEEKAFVELTKSAWNLSTDNITSPDLMGSLVLRQMRMLNYPVWSLEDRDTMGLFDFVTLYIKLVQNRGDEAHKVANLIGTLALTHREEGAKLKDFLTTENCREGMVQFLKRFEGGKLLALANQIGAEDTVLFDIQKLFSVEYSALWDKVTGEDEIRKLITEYEVIRHTNDLLNVASHSKEEAFQKWRDKLNFIGFSCESIQGKLPRLKSFFSILQSIAEKQDLLPDRMKSFLEETTNHLSEIKEVLDRPLGPFMEIYAPYLEGLSEEECEEIKNSISKEMFTSSETAGNAAVKKAAEDYRKRQLKTQLASLWKGKTKTKDPRDWSEWHRTPILCCVKTEEYADAKRAFDTLNSGTPNEGEIKDALAFLQETALFEDIASADYCDRCFADRILGDKRFLLTDINLVRDKLEETKIPIYEWKDHPLIWQVVNRMAEAEYKAGGSDKVIDLINGMGDAELKQWLTVVVQKDMGLGVKIIKNRGNQ